jgi:16S rRNA (cytosine967-C5)-methyltransferase
MTLRVNARRCTAPPMCSAWPPHGRGATLLDDPALAGQAVVLAEPCPVQQLPGFAEGEVSVQDAAAQRAASLLLWRRPSKVPKPGARVLDACAAPGGKTAQLLELAELDLLALDSDPVRLARIQDTLNRLQLRATLQGRRRTRPARLVGRQALRRHPAGRTLQRQRHRAPPPRHPLAAPGRRRGRAGAHPGRAAAGAVAAAGKPGGRLVYATCSIFKAEGQHRIDAFLQRLPPGAVHGWTRLARPPAAAGRQWADRPPPAPACAAGRLLLRPDPQDLTPAPPPPCTTGGTESTPAAGPGAAVLAWPVPGLPAQAREAWS